jgi:hypothetical protein
VPYTGELANKASHYDLLKNPDIAQFLSECDYLIPPSDEEGEALVAKFDHPTDDGAVVFPQKIIAVDGSRHESSIDDRLPSTKVGYVKVNSVLIDMTEFDALRVDNGRYVDPFRVAKLQDNTSSLSFSLPSANIRWQGKQSVRDGFRAAVDSSLYDAKTRFNPNDPTTSLRTTLFHLAALRPDEMGTGDPSRLILFKCPTCGVGPITVRDIPNPQYCDRCQAEIYPTDCLRLWEEISNYQSNLGAITRFMNVVEQLLPLHYVRYLAKNSLDMLANTAFFSDGPLAVFGTPAWLHASILRYLAGINQQLVAKGHRRCLMIGLQKSGQVVDYVTLIDRFIPDNRLMAIDDDFRYQHIFASREPARAGFGYETYYGQDFIYKTSSGRTFVFALPYPFATKREPTPRQFIKAKTELHRYPELSTALALIRHFESDLYENAVIPVALAHRYTAISLVPGGKVLDLLTRRAFHSKS